MISTDFAPNEHGDDALVSLKAIAMPWNYQTGSALDAVRQKLGNLIDPQNKTTTSLFLTGRSALYYYLQALNLPRGSEVLIQGFTCAAVPLPIIEAGLKPIYIDIEPDTYSMNIDDLRKKYTPGAKVLIIQHTFGFTPRYQTELLDFAKEKQLHVLLDLAHGFQPDMIQTTSHQLPAISYLLSFGRSKPFSSVFGGAILTTDRSISTTLSALEKELREPSIGLIIRCLLYKPLSVLIKATYDSGIGKLLHKLLHTGNLLIPEISAKEKKGFYDTQYSGSYPNALATLLLHQLKKYSQTSETRTTHAKRYDEQFSMSHEGNYPVTRYPVLRDDRDSILKHAAKKNIYFGKWYDQVVAPNSIDLQTVHYIPGSCPQAEDICKKILNLPLDNYVNL